MLKYSYLRLIEPKMGNVLGCSKSEVGDERKFEKRQKHQKDISKLSRPITLQDLENEITARASEIPVIVEEKSEYVQESEPENNFEEEKVEENAEDE